MINKKFLKAGDAEFVLRNNKNQSYIYRILYSESWKTYNVWLKKPEEGYIGVYDPIHNSIRTTPKATVEPYRLEYHALNYILDVIDGNQILPSDWYLNHTNRCGRCGRKLTTPESIETGLGPVCITRV